MSAAVVIFGVSELIVAMRSRQRGPSCEHRLQRQWGWPIFCFSDCVFIPIPATQESYTPNNQQRTLCSAPTTQSPQQDLSVQGTVTFSAVFFCFGQLACREAVAWQRMLFTLQRLT